MDIERNKANTRELYAACSKGNLDELDHLVAPDVVDHDDNTAFGDIAPGLAGLKQLMSIFRAGFPDLEFDVQHLVGEGDLTFARVVLRGTHTDTFLGIPATGRTIAAPAADVIRWQDGMAVEHWGVYDGATMLAQLGVAEPPGTA